MQDFWNWWQHIPSQLSPYLLQTEYFNLHYYGLMYVVGFIVVFLLLWYRIKHDNFHYSKELILDYFVWIILGVVIGGRLGYALFYNPTYFLANPIEIISPISLESGGIKISGISGMSYHGGLIGVIATTYFFCKKHNIDVWKFMDFIAPAVPLGYMFGRIGNFINGELYGRVTNASWGMYFDSKLRHPSQLYEALLEGLILFVILWWLRNKNYFKGFLLSMYIIGYAVARFIVELFRQPDPHLGFIVSLLTMGQVLSLIMFVCGAILFWYRKNKI